MQTKKRNPCPVFLFTCSMVIVFIACRNSQKDTNELLLQPGYEKIHEMHSAADCNSPYGPYITEVSSFDDGSSRFYQKFPDRDAPFIARLDKHNNGFRVNEHGLVLDTLNAASVEMIRGHEFHKISINPWFYFDSIRFVRQVRLTDRDVELFSGRDKLKNPVSLVYDLNKKRIDAIRLLNPGDTTESIEIIYDTWKETVYGDMALNLKIIQAGRDTFSFHFTSLRVRDKSGKSAVILP